MEMLKNIIIEEITFKEYTITFVYDKDWKFFWLLVNWLKRDDIVKEILNHWCDDEVEVYKWAYDENADQELNIKLIDFIFNEI